MNGPTLGVLDTFERTGGRGMYDPGENQCARAMATQLGYSSMGNAWDSRKSYQRKGWTVVPRGERAMEGDLGFYQHYGRQGGMGWKYGHIITIKEGADGAPRSVSYLSGRWQEHGYKQPDMVLRYTGGGSQAPTPPAPQAGASRPTGMMGTREQVIAGAVRGAQQRAAQAAPPAQPVPPSAPAVTMKSRAQVIAEATIRRIRARNPWGVR